MTRNMQLLLQILFVLFVTVAALGQVPTGTPPFGSFGGGPFDTVNLANLNAHFGIPVVNKAGRGMPFWYLLSYDSSVWYPVGVSGSQNWQSVANFGWRGDTEIATGYLSFKQFTTRCAGTGIHDGRFFFNFYNFIYHDPFGTSHPFSGSAIDGTDCPTNNSRDLNAIAADGSGYKLFFPGGNATSPQSLTSPSGQVTIPPSGGASVGAAQATDANGNQISVNSTGVFTDTLGTAVVTVGGTGTPSSPKTFTYTTPGGANQVTVHYTNKAVQTNFACSGVSEYGPTTIALITDITLPDGSKYTLQYEPTPGTTNGNVTGRIQSVTLPTGGTITYTYTGGSHGIICSDGSTAGLTRQTPDGTWTYARVQGSGAAWTTTATDPEGNQTALQFQGIYATERDVYQGLTTGTLLRTVYTCYNGSATPCNGTAVSLPITSRDVTTKLANNLQSRTTTLYNSIFGLVTEVDEYDFGSGAPGSLARKTVMTYGSWNGSSCTALGNGIVDRPCQITVQDGGGTTKAQTSYTYDEGTVTASAGTPQHVSISGSRGNPTTVKQLVAGTTTLNRTFTYFDTGNVRTDTAPNGAQTTYNYPDATSTCGNAFLTSVSLPLSLSTSATWSCSGGVRTAATDMNGQTASIGYNDTSFWRPTSFTDELNNVTNISYLYDGSNHPIGNERSLTFNANASTVDIRNNIDSLGRPSIAQRKRAPSATNYDSVQTTYDVMGRVAQVSPPYIGAAGASYAGTTWAATHSYDPLSRVSQIVNSANGTLAYDYSPAGTENNDVKATLSPAPTGENTKRKQYEYDALGRLMSVCEITSGAGNGTCNQSAAQTGYWTKYTYDVLNSLTGVTQNAQSASTQRRSYSYDGLSRLTFESNPESGTTIYTYDSDTGCSTTSADKGFLVKKTDAAGNVSCYLHDTLGRITKITYSGPYAANTPTKNFVYESATVNGVVMQNAKGRLAEAYTGTSTSKKTDEGFSYTARGELADIYESTSHSGGYYHIAQTYWENGKLKTLSGVGLPTLTYGADGEGRTSTVNSSTGLNPVSSTTYDVDSRVTNVSLGSGDPVDFTYNNNIGKMTQYKITINGAATYANLTWSANGTLDQLAITDPFNAANAQTCNYSYDDLARIAGVDCGATKWQQNFSYDPFGNITKTVPTGGAGLAFQPGYNLANNHYTLAGTSYDANGNLLADTFHAYTWDADGHSVTVDGTSLTLVFDALGREVEEQNSGVNTEYVYALGKKIAVMNGQTQSSAYVPLPGGAQVKYTGTTISTYRVLDWLGSPRVGSNPNRSYSWGLAYAPFGERYASSGSPMWSFTGANADTASDMYDFQFRELHDSQGRWISPDPAGPAAVDITDPQTWNRYVYVANRPLTAVDPAGLKLCAECHFLGLGGGSGGCSADGVDTPCDLAQAMLGSPSFPGDSSNGAAVQCPNNNCSPIYAGGQWLYFGAWADGSSGYLPLGFAAYSSGDLAELHLTQESDCIHKNGVREIVYSLDKPNGTTASGLYATEHQTDTSLANGPEGPGTSTQGPNQYGLSGFDDIIGGTGFHDSIQTFTISPKPAGTGGPNYPTFVRTQSGDYAKIGIYINNGAVYVNGNASEPVCQ